MALQDLTPQLRTRLSRMERAVGWFVILATLMLLVGFSYYVYAIAERKGWFKIKVPYYTFTDRATGLHEGDPVQLMGFDVGQITHITSQPPEDYEHNVYVEFEVKEPYFGYLWTIGSKAKVTTADLLGKRVLEVTKGTGGHATYIFNPLRTVSLAQAEELSDMQKWKFAQDIADASGTNLVVRALTPVTREGLKAIAAQGLSQLGIINSQEKRKRITAVWNDERGGYEHFGGTNKFWLRSDETPAVTERLEKIVGIVEAALPNILDLTNKLNAVLSNSTVLTAHLADVAAQARPAVSNLALATAQLDRPGGLGEWLLPTNVNQKLASVLSGADSTLNIANTNLVVLARNLNQSLENLANVTSNLNGQVQANTNILSAISRMVVDTDNLVQGLKHHWLFRSAFKKENAKAAAEQPSTSSPKQKNPR